MILMNERAAHARGWEFIMRFDDDQPNWIDHIGRDAMATHALSMVEDLAWLGIKVDKWIYHSREHERIDAWIKRLNIPVPNFYPEYWPIMWPKGRAYYPMTPYYTLEKVLMDWEEQCNWLVRGDELVSEFSLYAYFCRHLGISEPEQHFIPRLIATGGRMNEISKTRGNLKVKEFREMGWTPERVLDLTARSCLVDPAAGWVLPNVKERPVLDVSEIYPG
jgi:glutamyl/glutaminyl-tRNA synthetase